MPDLTTADVVTDVNTGKGDFLTSDTSVKTTAGSVVTGLNKSTGTVLTDASLSKDTGEAVTSIDKSSGIFVTSASLNSQTGDAVTDVKPPRSRANSSTRWTPSRATF